MSIAANTAPTGYIWDDGWQPVYGRLPVFVSFTQDTNNGPCTNYVVANCGAANNGTPNPQPRPHGCGLAIAQGVLSPLGWTLLALYLDLAMRFRQLPRVPGQLTALWRMVVLPMGSPRDLTMKPPTEQPARAQGWALRLQMRP
jgi:hypothetical protein